MTEIVWFLVFSCVTNAQPIVGKFLKFVCKLEITLTCSVNDSETVSHEHATIRHLMLI